MIKKIIFLSVLFVTNHLICFGQIDTVANRLRNENINKVVADSKITGYLTIFKTDGSYTDIDYTSTAGTAWPQLDHLNRLLEICIVYNKPSSSFYHSANLKAKIKSSFDFFAALPVKSINWWYEAIGIPIIYGPALILMKTNDAFGFDQATLNAYSAARLKFFAQSIALWPGASTGANKVWLLNGSIYKAAIENDATTLKSNFASVFSEVKVATTSSDGIKQDFSYYQHGPQLYCAGYGMAFLSDVTYFGLISNNTEFQMSSAQIKLLSDVTIEGYHWFAHKTAYDFGSNGREISRSASMSTGGLVTIIDRLISLNAPRITELQKCKSYLNGTADFQAPGNKHYWKMDMMVQHGTNFYLSAKFPSKRTVGTEWMNGENLKAKNLSWGATNIMNSGTEYKGIFATWDWSIIPGVTSCKETIAKFPTSGGKNLIPLSSFAGGVSNGSYGFAAYDFTGFTSNTDSYVDIVARKSYFFTPEAMYCMGVGIDANKTNPVITAINQCYSVGDVTVNVGGVKSIFADTLRNYRLTTLNWLHHNQVGYFFPTIGNNIYVGNKNQSGAWYDINTSESKTKLTNKVFSAWFNHTNMPVNGKYEYIVVPAKNISQFETWTTTNPLKSIVNERTKQAIYDKNAGIYGVVFYAVDSVVLESNLKVWADKPCIMLIQYVNATKTYKISVADPSASSADVTIKLSKKLSGSGVTNNLDNTSSIRFVLPTGENLTKTVTADFQDIGVSGLNNTNEDSRVVISPNPVTDILNIRTNGIVNPKIQIVEISGKVLFQMIPKNENVSINIKNKINNGIYFVRVVGVNYSNSVKIIVCR
jgi:hypothetical protein